MTDIERLEGFSSSEQKLLDILKKDGVIGWQQKIEFLNEQIKRRRAKEEDTAKLELELEGIKRAFANQEFLLKAIRISALVFDWIPPETWTKEFALEVVKVSGSYLGYVPESLRSREVVAQAQKTLSSVRPALGKRRR